MSNKGQERIVTVPFRLVRHVWIKVALSATLIRGGLTLFVTPVFASHTALTLKTPTTGTVPGTVNLYWISQSNAAGYGIRESTTSSRSFSGTATSVGNITSYQYPSLTPGTSYEFEDHHLTSSSPCFSTPTKWGPATKGVTVYTLGAANKFLILLPGEIAARGATTGTCGSAIFSGLTFNALAIFYVAALNDRTLATDVSNSILVSSAVAVRPSPSRTTAASGAPVVESPAVRGAIFEFGVGCAAADCKDSRRLKTLRDLSTARMLAAPVGLLIDAEGSLGRDPGLHNSVSEVAYCGRLPHWRSSPTVRGFGSFCQGEVRASTVHVLTAPAPNWRWN